MSPGQFILHSIESIVLLYSIGHLVANVFLIAAGFRTVLESVQSLGFDDLDLMDAGSATVPSIAVLVPAYNEDMSIVESVRALTETDYPDLEIVVINDGSSDETLNTLRRAFGMQRRDIPLRPEIPTARVRATYEAFSSLPGSVRRLVVVDKENGGRADALNAGLNACISPYFVTIDADSILDPEALKQLVRILQEDPNVAATGGSIGVVNACTLDRGRVVRTAVSRSYIVLCQTVEYLRSFSLSRTGFTRLDGLVILSGAFLVMRRQLCIDVGGFLTGRSQSRWLQETVGPGAATICEDMELIVRTHRHLRDHGRKARIVHAPVPVCWTEVPSNASDLGKQRNRWHRGLIEILRHHREMIFNPGFGRIGLFSLPYFVVFELMGPYIELLGWLVLPILAVIGWIDPVRVALIMAIALGAGILQSLVAVMSATWLESVSSSGHDLRSFMRTDRWRDRWYLVAGCFVAELGYRQMTLFWRLHGTWDYFRGRTGWDKFERKGFKTAASLLALLGTLAAGATISDAGPADRREVTAVVGVEDRHTGNDLNWQEVFHKWEAAAGPTWLAGGYRRERGDGQDYGLLLGIADRPWASGGYGVELRAGGGEVGARWSVSAESEFVAFGPVTTANRVRYFRHKELSLLELSPGAVYYFRGSWWFQLRVLVSGTFFDAGDSDWQTGAQGTLSAPWGNREVRLRASTGSESFFVNAVGPRLLRSQSFGVELIQPVAQHWSVRGGVDRWIPERGSKSVYLHLGVTWRYGEKP